MDGWVALLGAYATPPRTPPIASQILFTFSRTISNDTHLLDDVDFLLDVFVQLERLDDGYQPLVATDIGHLLRLLRVHG